MLPEPAISNRVSAVRGCSEIAASSPESCFRSCVPVSHVWRNLADFSSARELQVSPHGGPMVNSFRDLLVWQKAMDLADAIYTATTDFPRHELFGLTAQLSRAAVENPARCKLSPLAIVWHLCQPAAAISVTAATKFATLGRARRIRGGRSLRRSNEDGAGTLRVRPKRRATEPLSSRAAADPPYSKHFRRIRSIYRLRWNPFRYTT